MAGEERQDILVKNIVFDIAGVLLRYDPVSYLEKFTDNRGEAEKLAKITFLSPDWEELDRGLINRDEIMRRLSEKHPDFKDSIKRAISSWPQMLEPIEENINLAKKLRENNYPLYLLSNFPEEGYEDTKARFDFFDIFKGGVVSGEITYLKPEGEIFQVLLEKFTLDPEHTVFIDDTEENARAAEEHGIIGVHYDGETGLEEKLRRLNVNL